MKVDENNDLEGDFRAKMAKNHPILVDKKKRIT